MPDIQRAAADPAPVIDARGLSKRYALYDRPSDRLLQMLWRGRRQFHREFWALRGVDLRVLAGEVVGIVGRNGSGKSTLLQLVCGTLEPTEGSLATRGRIAPLLELGAGFNPEFSGRENVRLSASILGLTPQEIDERFDDIVAFSGIRDFIDQPVKTYSSGMFVRLAFSVAISVDPDILVIDEALAVGDGEFAHKSFKRIMQLRDAGRTILFCSHSMYQIEALCTRAVWLDGGRVALAGTPAEVVAAYNDFTRRLQAPEPPPAFAPAAQGGAGALAQREAQAHAQPSAPPGRARITRVALITADGHAASHGEVVSGVTDLRVRVDFASDPGIGAPALGIVLLTEDRRPVASSGTHNDALRVARDASGRGSVTLVYPALPLLKGVYQVDAYLLDDTGIHTLDAAMGAARFGVVQRGLEMGVVSLAHRWSFGDGEG